MTIIDKFVQPGNYTPGRDGHRIQWLILHTEDGNNGSAWSVFNDPGKQRSAQYLVGENGEVIHAVADGDTAWGAANWLVNQGGINIEHEDLGNYNDPVRTDAEYQSSAELVAELCRKNSLPCVKVEVGANKMPLGPGIVLHREVSQSGTACPDGLDWQRIIRQAQGILGGTVPAPSVLPPSAEIHSVNQTVKVVWQNLQVRSDAVADDSTDPITGRYTGNGFKANTPDGMLHNGNIFTITGWKRGEHVNQNGVDSDVWVRSVWGHWSFAGGTTFPLDTVGALAPAPVPTPVVAPAPEPAPQTSTPAPNPVESPAQPPLQSGIEEWDEDHKVIYTKRAGTTVDTLSTGAVQKDYAVGQRVDQSGTFTVAGRDYVRTEFGFKKGTWNGIPAEAFIDADPAPTPAPTPAVSPAPTSTPAVDSIVRPTSVPVQSVPSAPAQGLTIRQRLIAALATLVGGGSDVVDAITALLSRQKK